MVVKNTANIGFERKIWDAACVLWGHIPASEYRNVIIGLIFLKYISTGMRAIEADNPKLKDVLPKNYASSDLDKRVLGDVVDLFTNMDMRETEGNRDVLGRTYEYCIAQFAEKEGKGGGEFYTPSSIVNTLVSILKPYSNCRVYEMIIPKLIQFNDYKRAVA